MPIQVHAVIFGVGLVVAVGTAIYYLLNSPQLTAPHPQRRPQPEIPPQLSRPASRRNSCNSTSGRSRRRNQWDTCSICLDSLDTSITSTTLKRLSTLQCGHQFHNHCITMWLNQCKACPLCRQAA